MSVAIVTTETNERIVERIQSGDIEAFRILWEKNKRLAAYISSRYAITLGERRDCDLGDLMQAGYIGIHKAAEKYDPSRGAKFTTYAIFSIKREMRRALGILTDKRDPILDAAPLDAPILDNGHDRVNLIDTLTAPKEENPIEQTELKAAVRAAVERIKHDVARRTVKEYYFEGKTEPQQAEAEGVCTQNISDRLYKGYRELYNDSTLREWAVDYGYTNFYRRKSGKAFNTSFTSAVEDIVIWAEEQQNRRAALYEVLGSLV